MKKHQFQQLLEYIVNSEAKQLGDFKATAQIAAELLSQQINVSSVVVSALSAETNTLEQITRLCLGVNTSSASVIRPNPGSCTNFIHQLKDERHISAEFCGDDSRLVELKPYYQALGIISVLEVAIRINGHLEGILSLERTEATEPWHDSEVQLCSQVADQLALTLATQYGYEKDERLTLFLSAAEQSDQIMMVVNLASDCIEYVNKAHADLTKVPRERVLGRQVQSLDFFRQYPTLAALVLKKARIGETSEEEVNLVRHDGSPYWMRFSVKRFISERGNHFALVNAEDCTEQHNHQSELLRLAWRCGLTGLYNRTHFSQVLEKAQKGHLVLIDLREFKRFNDTYGHANGDIMLIEVARRMRHFAEAHQISEVARIGSDEFGILFENEEDEIFIEHATERLYKQLEVPITIGIEQIEPKPALARVDLASIEQQFSLLTCADIALQYAKNKQGNAIQVFNSALLNAFKEDAQIERDLAVAIKGRQFELYYQPLKDLKKQSYIGAEALIRWHHPKKGVLYPGAFIDIAEQTGLINDIGSWVLEAACKQLNLWQRHQIDISMHVNVSARQFFSGTLFEQVWELVTRYRLKPHSLILEITETELMEDIRSATNLCHELAALGVGLAIDDFGTGYSSMRYLKQFPISKLKIDRSFISDLSVSHESREIVSAIIAMASALNISLTAEGVETKEQEHFLAEHSCHQAQGFLYSPALRVSEFGQFLEKSASIH
ncbi:diguanylate cyclase/phosphodiesterase with PAS/PAC and GAF sensor(s) [Shewanella halifaxensis HAW-EB4]|uniref:Diguanylate cyclase/phosphodiesterase with PAS/PAC and GAF sensor(S) n=1 Tax=Shewanella halifaxensis (strain HAW-EB4) TaxID=458817 RepID=B0TSC5_SHEHH|nr:EAL domain-containing protein [Shewanella halifaxensis]ABZ76505.1 diguanylate cyclase/phosphodiesterase with PAS/PAC and GAF sensor(s) [Shewanella halifaxensis HAW-EB4]